MIFITHNMQTHRNILQGQHIDHFSNQSYSKTFISSFRGTSCAYLKQNLFTTSTKLQQHYI